MTNPIDAEFEQIVNPPSRKVTLAERIGQILSFLLATTTFLLLISGGIWLIVKIWTSILSMM